MKFIEILIRKYLTIIETEYSEGIHEMQDLPEKGKFVYVLLR